MCEPFLAKKGNFLILRVLIFILVVVPYVPSTGILTTLLISFLDSIISSIIQVSDVVVTVYLSVHLPPSSLRPSNKLFLIVFPEPLHNWYLNCRLINERRLLQLLNDILLY